MRRAVPLLVVLLLGAAAPPPGEISANVEYVTTLTEPATAIAINFIDTTMFVSTMTGIFSYDVSDPAAPRLLGVLPVYVYENEDMDVDPERDLLLISRDPRGFTSPVTPEQARFLGQLEIIDVSDPALMLPVGAITLPAGHTSTCVSAGDGPCDFVWTGGPYGSTALGEPRGRPIYATDIRNPSVPVRCPEPINTGLDEAGATGYAHDVQVDAEGVAWVSSDGGVHGYWTHGLRLDPTTGKLAEATPCAPVPYAGGVSPAEATPSRFMHNAWRDVDAAIPGDKESAGQVLYATEENLSSDCASSGRFATYDLRTSRDGRGFTDPTGFALSPLDAWTPEDAEGATGCASAHYLDDRGDGLVAYAFYGQGVRFLDVSDPRDIRQVGYYRPDGASTWAPYWYGDDYVFVADNGRGVDVLRFHGGAAPDALPEVVAPPLGNVAAAALVPDPRFAGLCLIPGGAS